MNRCSKIAIGALPIALVIGGVLGFLVADQYFRCGFKPGHITFSSPSHGGVVLNKAVFVAVGEGHVVVSLVGQPLFLGGWEGGFPQRTALVLPWINVRFDSMDPADFAIDPEKVELVDSEGYRFRVEAPSRPTAWGQQLAVDQGEFNRHVKYNRPGEYWLSLSLVFTYEGTPYEVGIPKIRCSRLVLK